MACGLVGLERPVAVLDWLEGTLGASPPPPFRGRERFFPSFAIPAADAQLLDQVGIALLAVAAQVAEQALAAADHLQQTLAGREVMDVALQVTTQLADALAQHRHLNFHGTGVGAMGLVSVD